MFDLRPFFLKPRQAFPPVTIGRECSDITDPDKSSSVFTHQFCQTPQTSCLLETISEIRGLVFTATTVSLSLSLLTLVGLMSHDTRLQNQNGSRCYSSPLIQSHCLMMMSDLCLHHWDRWRLSYLQLQTQRLRSVIVLLSEDRCPPWGRRCERHN